MNTQNVIDFINKYKTGDNGELRRVNFWIKFLGQSIYLGEAELKPRSIKYSVEYDFRNAYYGDEILNVNIISKDEGDFMENLERLRNLVIKDLVDEIKYRIDMYELSSLQTDLERQDELKDLLEFIDNLIKKNENVEE